MQNIENLIYWKRSPETLQVLKAIQDQIQLAKDEIVDGALLISPHLEREYCRATGFIAGLHFIEDLLKEEEIDDGTFT